MNNISITLQFVTPLFLHGADVNAPEIRVPSIRGQLRDWFRMLGGTTDEEQSVFGGLHGGSKRNEPVASRIVLRVVDRTNGTPKSMATLPHKQGGPSAMKNGFHEAFFDLLVSSRLGLSKDSEDAFLRALKAWLLLGGLGQRATRGGGSLKWAGWNAFPYPDTLDIYREACRAVLDSAPLRAEVLEQPFDTETEARKVVTNTLGGPFPCHFEDVPNLRSINDPLGFVQKQSRKVSTLKLTIRKIGQQFFIVAVWDDRGNVTGNRTSDLHDVIDLLADHKPQPKKIGLLLRESKLYTSP